MICALVALTCVPAPAWAEAGVDLGTFPDALSIEVPAEGTVELVAGDARYVLNETIELHPRGTSLVLVNDVSMQGYLEGIAEVPVYWHDEALKAQVVAARTYAWRTMRTDASRPYEICATVACQVFKGREIIQAPGGDRWAGAVADTRDEVLLHDGRPILARYSSTSGGHTRNNEHVFPSSGAYPYLRGVPDPEDDVSPLHRWEVVFTRDEFDAILARGERLSAAVPVAAVENVAAGDGHPDRLRLTSSHGRSVVVNASDFRFFVSSTAPDLFPERFPPTHTTGRPLPQTLPSSRLTFALSDDEVVVRGRGFGHGVGMSQYGALGKAEQGMGYHDILAAYYGGIRPSRDARVPERVRVGVADRDASFTFRADVPARLRVGGRTVTERAIGTWEVRRDGGGLRLIAPTGFGAPLVITPPQLEQRQLTGLHRIEIISALNKSAEVWLSVRDATGEEVLRRAEGVVDAGPVDLSWSVGDLPAGRYEVAVVAADETGTELGDPIGFEVEELSGDAQASSSLLGPPPVRGGVPPLPVGAGIIGAVAGAAISRRIEET